MTDFQRKEYKGKIYKLEAPPITVLRGEKAFVPCTALQMAESLMADRHTSTGPWQYIRTKLSKMPEFVKDFYETPYNEADVEVCEYWAIFKDKSILVWLTPFEEWGFQYGFSIRDPFIGRTGATSYPNMTTPITPGNTIPVVSKGHWLGSRWVRGDATTV